MRTIPLSHSIVVFWEDLIFLEAALLADDETRTLAAPVTPLIDEFTLTFQRDLETRRTLIQANARASVADARLDLGIRGLFSATLHLVGQNRKRVEFATLFKTHIGAVVRHALKRQIEVARELRGKLSLPHYAAEFRATHEAALAPLVARGVEVLEEQRQAELTRVGGRLEVRAWKEEANAVRLSIYASLLSLAAQTGRGKAWAEAFFPRKNAAAADGGEEAETEAEPAGDAGTPGDG
jgi:hypothetical protein